MAGLAVKLEAGVLIAGRLMKEIGLNKLRRCIIFCFFTEVFMFDITIK